MATKNLIITKVQNPVSGAFEATTQEKLTTHSGLVPSFHAAWVFVQHESTHTIRIFLSTLKHAKTVCVHLAEDIDKLIVVVEARLREIENLDRDVRTWEHALRRVGYR